MGSYVYSYELSIIYVLLCGSTQLKSIQRLFEMNLRMGWELMTHEFGLTCSKDVKGIEMIYKRIDGISSKGFVDRFIWSKSVSCERLHGGFKRDERLYEKRDLDRNGKEFPSCRDILRVIKETDINSKGIERKMLRIVHSKLKTLNHSTTPAHIYKQF